MKSGDRILAPLAVLVCICFCFNSLGLAALAQGGTAVPMQDTYALPAKGLADKLKVDIEAAQFGTYTSEGDFTETKVVPLKVGQSYGWKMKLSQLKPDAKVKWKEEFTLPAAPKRWGNTPAVVSKEKTTNVMEKEDVPMNGWIGNAWSVAEGDPPGKYLMKIYINENLVKTFKFQVK